MIERGNGECFAREARSAIGVDRGDLAADLSADLALQSRIAGPIDLAHSAGASSDTDFIGTELSARLNGMALIMAARYSAANGQSSSHAPTTSSRLTSSITSDSGTGTLLVS